MIKSSFTINGIVISNSVFKISTYADDTVIITDGSLNDIVETVSILKKFCKASGLNVNLDKSSLFPLGPLFSYPPPYFETFDFVISNESVKYLGISFTHHHDDFFQLNYVPKLSRIQKNY